MGHSTARKLEFREDAEAGALEEKRKHGLAMLMAAIWHRHNPRDDAGSLDAEGKKREDYLADIW